MTATGTLTISVKLAADAGERITTRIEIPITVDSTSILAAAGDLDHYLADATARIIGPAAGSIRGIGGER